MEEDHTAQPTGRTKSATARTSGAATYDELINSRREKTESVFLALSGSSRTRDSRVFKRFVLLKSTKVKSWEKKRSGAYIPCQFDLLHHLPVSLFRVGRGFWSGPAPTGFLPFSLLTSPPSLVTGAEGGGERGCQEGEWRAKPVLTQHLKPPHKYRLPFPISKAALSTSVYTLARRSVSCARGCEFKNDRGTSGKDSPRGEGL